MAEPKEVPRAGKKCPVCDHTYEPEASFCPRDGAELASESEGDPYLGEVLLGHIEIQELVGVGAMGRVYRALQRGMDRDVAVKILHRELSANKQLVARFNREAKVASRLAHPHIVHVYMRDQLPDGSMFIVMEYLDGLSLGEELARQGGLLPAERAYHIMTQLCDAVGEAHARGIIHRDLKPENVMLVRRSTGGDFVKVLDFGVAKQMWGEQSMATAAGLIFGTARYISPEGAQGLPVEAPGDVYALATMYYQMLSGRTPFRGEQAVGVLVSQIHDAPPPLPLEVRGCPVDSRLAAVIMQNLDKDPAKRAVDARAFGDRIRAVVEGGATPVPELRAPDLFRDGTVPTTEWRPPESFQVRLAEATPQTLDDDDADVGRRATAYGPPLVPSPPRLSGHESEEPVYPQRRRAVRTLAVALVCFMVGVLGASLIVWRLAERTPDDEGVLRVKRLREEGNFLGAGGACELAEEILRNKPTETELLSVRDECQKRAAAAATQSTAAAASSTLPALVHATPAPVMTQRPSRWGDAAAPRTPPPTTPEPVPSATPEPSTPVPPTPVPKTPAPTPKWL